MEFARDMFSNPVVIAAILGWTVAQVSKCILYMIINKKFTFERMVGGGGMPSSHSATVCALCTAVGMTEGGSSTLFAVCIAFAFIVMYDAMNVRLETGKQGKVINDMLEIFKSMDLKFMMDKDISPEKKLKELVGHTPLQVLVGAGVGILVAYLTVTYL